MGFWDGSTDQNASLTEELLKINEWYNNQAQQNQINTANKGVRLNNLAIGATSIDSLNKLLPQIKSYNKEVQMSGNSEMSINWQDKHSMYTEGQQAYEKAKIYEDKLLEDPDKQYNEIMSYSWQDAAEEMKTLQDLQSQINNSVKAGFVYKSNGQYTSGGLLKAVTKRMNQLANKNKIFEENEGQFLVYDSNGNMDEESRRIYEDLQFKVLSGNTQDFELELEGMITSTATKYNAKEKEYMVWKQISDISSKKQTQLGEIDFKGLAGKGDVAGQVAALMEQAAGQSGLTDNDFLDPEWVKERMMDAQIAADKYNKQHLVLTGDYHVNKYPWMASQLEELNNNDIDGFKSDNPAELTGTYETKTLEEDIEEYKFQQGEDTEITEEDAAATSAMLEEKVLESGSSEVSEEDMAQTEAMFEGNKEKRETDFNDYIESEASSEGIDYRKVTAKVATAGIFIGAAASDENVQKVAKTMYKATKDGAKYLSTAYNLSGDDIATIMKEVNSKKGTVSSALSKIDNLQKQIAKYDSNLDEIKKLKKDLAKENLTSKRKIITEKIKKLKNIDPYKVRRLEIQNKINEIRKGIVEGLAKKLTKGGSKVRPEDVARIMSNKEMSKWNPIKVKDFLMNKSPGAMKKWLTTSKTAKIGVGLLQYRTGAAIKDAIGFDIGEGFIADTVEDVAVTTAATKTLNLAGKAFIPRLKAIANSPAGRKALQKFLGKQTGKFLIKQAAGSSVPGIGNIAMAVVGAGLSIKDFIQFVNSFK